LDVAHVIELALEHVFSLLPAHRLVCLWRGQGDSRVLACIYDESGQVKLNGRQEELALVFDQTPQTPFLFDAVKGRILLGHEDVIKPSQCLPPPPRASLLAVT
jgi:hypothetical protein